MLALGPADDDQAEFMHVGDGIEIKVVAEQQLPGRTAIRFGIQSGTAAELRDVIDGVKHDDGIAIEAGSLGGRFHFLDMIGRDLGRHQVGDLHQPGPGFLQPPKFEEFMEDRFLPAFPRRSTPARR